MYALAWFGRSAAARQHNLASVMRAVENRVPVVIASNAGPSQVIDADGRVRASAASWQAVFVGASIAPRRTGSFYVRAGDWWIAVALVLVVVAGAWRSRTPSA